MINIIFKTIIIYFFVILVMRLMGKKQVGQLQPYELVITLIIADLASMPMNTPGSPISFGVVPAITIMLIYFFITFIIMKSQRARLIVCGMPTIVIKEGFIERDELKKLKYNLSDLLEQLRTEGYTDVSQIHYAILETNGALSVFPYAAYGPLRPIDMSMSPEEEEVCTAVIMDRKMLISELKHFNADIAKMRSTLTSHNLQLGDVFFASMRPNGMLHIQLMDGKIQEITTNWGKIA